MSFARARSVVPLSLLAVVGCEFFHPTTVPATDNSDPWAVIAIYADGRHQDIRVGDMTIAEASNTRVFERVTQDPWESFIALSAGVDGGGIRQVEMHSRVFARCVYGPANLQILEPWAVQRTTRTGSPGDIVQNGLYLYKNFRGIDYVDALDFCSDDNYQVTIQWSSRAWDFSNNFAAYGSGRVTYVQFGS